MNLKRFLINLMSNCLSALSGILLSFFLTPYIVETLGKEAYGFFPLSNSFIMYAAVITTALNSMSSRFITISLEKNEEDNVQTYFTSVFFGNLIISLFVILFGTAFCYFIHYFLAIPVGLIPDVRLLFVFVFLGLIVNLTSSVFSVSAFALNRFDKLALINIGVNVIKLLIIFILFYFFSPKLYFLGLASLCSSIYFFYKNYRLTKKILPQVSISISSFSWASLYVLLGAGVWNSVMALSNVINTQVDLLIANRFFGASEMGVLSLTKIIPSAVQLLLGVVVPLFLPDLLKAYANNDAEEMKFGLRFSFKAIFIVCMIPLSIFFVYGLDFFKLWLPTEDHNQLYLLSIITLIPFVIHATIETIHHVFVITNKLKWASFWGIFISCFSFLLVILLSAFSNFGLYSIPLATLITGVLSHLTFTPWYAAKCLNESPYFFYRQILLGLLRFGLLIGIGMLWKSLHLINTVNWGNFILNFAIVFILLLFTSIAIMFDSFFLKNTFVRLRNKLIK